MPAGSSLVYEVSYRLIGYGGYGFAHEAVEIPSRKVVAIKTSLTLGHVKRTFSARMQGDTTPLRTRSHSSCLRLWSSTEFRLHGDGVAWKGLNAECTRVAEEGGSPLVKTSLSALKYIHSKGRDIKPHNILRSLKDPTQVVLIDFGLTGPVTSKREEGTDVRAADWASINAHRGLDLAPRDDLESFTYKIAAPLPLPRLQIVPEAECATEEDDNSKLTFPLVFRLTMTAMTEWTWIVTMYRDHGTPSLHYRAACWKIVRNAAFQTQQISLMRWTLKVFKLTKDSWRRAAKIESLKTRQIYWDSLRKRGGCVRRNHARDGCRSRVAEEWGTRREELEHLLTKLLKISIHHRIHLFSTLSL